MTRTSPTTTLRRKKRNGFTLIEILLVAAIIALMAAMVLPRNMLSFVTPLRAMQRAVTEITDLAMNGYSVRLRVEPTERSDRGRLVVEALMKAENSLEPNRMLEWLPIEIANLPEGEGWRLEPEIIYFYSEGACTPGRVMRADEGESITEGDFAMLTVTGFLVEREMYEERH